MHERVKDETSPCGKTRRTRRTKLPELAGDGYQTSSDICETIFVWSDLGIRDCLLLETLLAECTASHKYECDCAIITAHYDLIFYAVPTRFKVQHQSLLVAS